MPSHFVPVMLSSPLLVTQKTPRRYLDDYSCCFDFAEADDMREAAEWGALPRAEERAEYYETMELRTSNAHMDGDAYKSLRDTSVRAAEAAVDRALRRAAAYEQADLLDKLTLKEMFAVGGCVWGTRMLVKIAITTAKVKLSQGLRMCGIRTEQCQWRASGRVAGCITCVCPCPSPLNRVFQGKTDRFVRVAL